jgi:GAF domain-containing protein
VSCVVDTYHFILGIPSFRGTGIGMVVGCIIGMCPLLFIDSNKIQVLKREAHLDTMFQDVMTEASSLIGAQRACLYLIVNPQEDKSWFFSSSKKKHPKPTPDGKFLYAKYDATSSPSSPSSLPKVSDRYIPLGRGIVSRAALTGEAWNIYSVQSEPEFVAGHDTPEASAGDPSSSSSAFRIDNMLCVPVLDGQGRAIAVIQAVNKVSRGTTFASTDNETGDGDGKDEKDGMKFLSLPLLSPNRGFTGHDVQVLKALATHISVSLQRMYEDLAGGGSSDELRLRDTIAMLKDSGLEGVDIQSASSSSHRTALFPED